MIFQKDILGLIRDNTKDGSFYFSNRNLEIIEEQFGWKPKNVLNMLWRLRQKGLLKCLNSRSYVLPEKWDEYREEQIRSDRCIRI